MEKRKRIAVLMGEADKFSNKNFIEGFLKKAFEFDYDVLVFSAYRMYQETTSREQGDTNIFSLVPYDMFDAVVVFADTIQTPGVLGRIEEELVTYFKGKVLFVDRESERFDTIFMEDYKLAKCIISHLIEEDGCTDIAYLTGKPWVKQSVVRVQAFRDCMAEHGLEVREDRILYGDFWYSSGYSVVEKLLKKPENLPQAIACANDCMAIGAADALTKAGFRIPEDIAIIGYEYTEESATSPSPITSIYVPYYEYGEYACEYIDAALKDKKIDRFDPDAKLFIGRSCGCDTYVEPVQSRLRDKWETERSGSGFYDVSNSMMEDIMSQTKFMDLLNIIYTYTYQIRPFESFNLCLNACWGDTEKLISRENGQSNYTDTMINAIKCGNSDGDDSEIGVDNTFDLQCLLPELYEKRDKPSAFFFTPLFFENSCMGYAVVSYGSAPVAYSSGYRLWICNVMRGLESFRRLEIVNRYRELIRTSMFQDDITGLCNYDGFMNETAELAASGRRLCIVSADIKAISQINKKYGRKEGDRVIARVGKLIKRCKSARYVCRLGNDEYLMASISEDGDVAEKMKQELSAFVDKENNTGKKYTIEICFGEAAGIINDMKDIEHLINESISCKNGNKRSLEPTLDALQFNEEEKKIAEVVKNILDNNLFTYHFQPIIYAGTGEIFSYEALMRSNTSVMVSPLDILKYAEAINRIYDVEKNTFCNVIKLINENSLLFENKKVFINSIPGVKLSDADVDYINQQLKDHNGQIVVELTEQAELNDAELAVLKHKYKELGVEMAVDDYGTGYSNVTNLLRYMPKYVKIDRTLLTEIQNSPQKQHFVSEIIEFAHSNDILALAEGIETSEELQMVIHLGVDLIQGYYVAKPSEEIIQTIAVNVKREINQLYTQEIYNKNNNTYVAGKEFRISLAKLVSDEYECIVVSNEESTYRDLSVVGVPGQRSGIVIRIEDGYHGTITVENVSLAGKRGLPCINLGDNCDVTMVLKGDNYLRTGGIRVPETSRLTLTGDGDIFIDCNYEHYFGIGNDIDKAHGDLSFEQSGAIEIQGNASLGIGIGAGLGGNISFFSGKVILNMTGKDVVCVGSIDGDTNINIGGCDIVIGCSVYNGVGIGSMNGRVKCSTSHIAVNVRVTGTQWLGIGSRTAVGNELNIHNCSVNMSSHTKEICGVGSYSGDAAIDVRFASINLTLIGEKKIVVGDFDRKSILYLVNAEINAETDERRKLISGIKPENLHIEEGGLNFEV